MASPLYLTLLAGPVEAVPVPKPVIDAFVSAEITESATEPSGFQLTFTLADDSILQTLLLLAGRSADPGAARHPGRHVRRPPAGRHGRRHRAPRGGARRDERVLEAGRHRARPVRADGPGRPFTGLPYPGTSPDLRVLAILAKYAAFGIVPEVVPVPAPDIPVPVQRIPVQQGTDLAYVQQLAKQVGYVFYLTPGPLPGMTQAYWGPQVRIGIPQPALNVNMDAWTNVESLIFRYQPQASVLPVVYIQDPITGVPLPVPIPPVTPFNPPLGLAVPVPQKVRQLNDTAKRSPAEALMLGMAEAVQHADVVTGNGTLDVDRYGQILRARSLVGVRGAGLAFDGMHYVDSVHPQPQARRVQAELRAQAQRPHRRPAGGAGPAVLREAHERHRQVLRQVPRHRHRQRRPAADRAA